MNFSIFPDKINHHSNISRNMIDSAENGPDPQPSRKGSIAQNLDTLLPDHQLGTGTLEWLTEWLVRELMLWSWWLMRYGSDTRLMPRVLSTGAATVITSTAPYSTWRKKGTVSRDFGGFFIRYLHMLQQGCGSGSFRSGPEKFQRIRILSVLWLCKVV